MIEELIQEYLANAEAAELVDCADAESVQRLNDSSDRMRAIVTEVAAQGPTVVHAFATLLDRPPASVWAAHHLVEIAEPEPTLFWKCIACVERAQQEAEANGEFADAMGEAMWLKEWRAKR